MHTSAFETCLIHHNGGYDGDVYITNEDSTSKPIGKKATIQFSSKELVKLGERGRRGIVTLKSISKDPKEEEHGKQITIARKDVENYAYDVLMDKVTRKLENGGVSYKRLKWAAAEMGIKNTWPSS